MNHKLGSFKISFDITGINNISSAIDQIEIKPVDYNYYFLSFAPTGRLYFNGIKKHIEVEAAARKMDASFQHKDYPDGTAYYFIIHITPNTDQYDKEIILNGIKVPSPAYSSTSRETHTSAGVLMNNYSTYSYFRSELVTRRFPDKELY